MNAGAEYSDCNLTHRLQLSSSIARGSSAAIAAMAPQLTEVEAAWLLGFKAGKPDATGDEVTGGSKLL